MDTKHIDKSDGLFVSFFIVMSLFMIYKIHLGLHFDEAYLVDLGKVKMDGIKGVTEYWDILQMAGYILYPFIYLYHLALGSYEGVILYFRYIYLCIHTCITIYSYYTIVNIWGKRQARVISSIAFLFSFYWYSVCYRSILFWGLLLVILFILRYSSTGNFKFIVFSAIAFCVATLCYPTLIFMVIPFSMFLIRVGSSRKEVILFWCTCIIVALLVAAGLVVESGWGIFDSWQYSVSYDEDMDHIHKIKTCIGIILVFLSGVAVRYFYQSNKRIMTKIQNYNMLVFFIIVAFLGAIVVARPMSAGVSRFWYTYVLFFFLMLPECYECNQVYEHGIIKYLFFIPSIWLIFIIALSTANGVAIAAYGCVFGIMGLLICLTDKSMENDIFSRVLVMTIILMFLFCMFFFVPDNELGSSNIFWKRYYITDGPGKGIKVTEESYNNYKSINDVVSKYVMPRDSVFILGNGYRSYGFLCTEAKQATNRAYFVSPKSKRIVEYFESNIEMIPSVIMIDGSLIAESWDTYGMWEEESALGVYINQHYTFYDRYGDWYIYVLDKE